MPSLGVYVDSIQFNSIQFNSIQFNSIQQSLSQALPYRNSITGAPVTVNVDVHKINDEKHNQPRVNKVTKKLLYSY